MYLENKEVFAAVEPLNDVDAMHIWRSKFVDKASKCETEIRRIAVAVGDKKMPFKALAEKILADRRKIESGKKSEPIVKLLEELVPLIELRAELVHSQIVNEKHSKNGFLFLSNAQGSHAHFDRIVSLTAEQRKIAYDRIATIAGQMAKLS
ncbi:hypothetical protein [Sphingorhabdus sp.]|jgi:hypothetical protein|uniref:hypothetical protein n=1 Tax=Sphingorhabdus sp. TaxID=1902408 RepID=UPI003BB1F7B1|nr:hypothetical protein [Sphingomonadales bacterium]MBK9431042.1 hypothetical protein [Sphingomonadales bacterium]MBL0021183.1 hypothetical protein [Sphingomonadales bacterium]